MLGEVTCPHCGTGNEAGSRYCGECGRALPGGGALPRTVLLANPALHLRVPDIRAPNHRLPDARVPDQRLPDLRANAVPVLPADGVGASDPLGLRALTAQVAAALALVAAAGAVWVVLQAPPAPAVKAAAGPGGLGGGAAAGAAPVRR